MNYAILYFLIALCTLLFGILKIDEGISIGVSQEVLYSGGFLLVIVALWSFCLGLKELRSTNA